MYKPPVILYNKALHVECPYCSASMSFWHKAPISRVWKWLNNHCIAAGHQGLTAPGDSGQAGESSAPVNESGDSPPEHGSLCPYGGHECEDFRAICNDDACSDLRVGCG